jgi:hypothetical protein
MQIGLITVISATKLLAIREITAIIQYLASMICGGSQITAILQ